MEEVLKYITYIAGVLSAVLILVGFVQNLLYKFGKVQRTVGQNYMVVTGILTLLTIFLAFFV